ncbi:MAG: hypothetical protein J0L53_07095 [Spirochaetes bacterium]|nr:hypothetical protein [Spirochaetota bacterium]
MLFTTAGQAERRWFAGGGMNLVLPYSWHTDSVYTYDSMVDWYRSARYDFGWNAAPLAHFGFEEMVSENYRFGLEFGYAFTPTAYAQIQTSQQVGNTLVKIEETATLTHHAPRISARIVRRLSDSWNIIYRLGVEDHIVVRSIDPQPQNLPAGVNLTPANAPTRRDIYGVLTADLAAGVEYVADGKHGFALLLSVNPPVVYPETVRNHIVMPYFATASFVYRYLW